MRPAKVAIPAWAFYPGFSFWAWPALRNKNIVRMSPPIWSIFSPMIASNSTSSDEQRVVLALRGAESSPRQWFKRRHRETRWDFSQVSWDFSP